MVYHDPFQCGESPLTMRAAERPANALRTLGSYRTSFGPLDWRPVAADNALRTRLVVVTPLGLLDRNRSVYR